MILSRLELESIEALLLLPALPLLLWWFQRRAKPAAAGFSCIAHAAQAGRSLRQRVAFLPAAARWGAMALLVAALARPREGLEKVRESHHSIAMQLVIDRSGSMQAEMDFHGQRLSRLEVVRRVVRDFVLGDGSSLPGRPSDLIGLIAFAAFADTVCPLTLAHDLFPDFLETLQAEGNTALGDAIALGAARLKTAEETLARQTKGMKNNLILKSKVMLVLTDGRNNSGQRDPLPAAQLAAEWGIRIYAVGIGGPDRFPPGPSRPGRFPSFPLSESVDETVLKAVAERTGGFFRMVEDAGGLRAVCHEIDQLERTPLQITRFRNYREWFAPLALAALLLLGVEMVLNCTLFRTVP